MAKSRRRKKYPAPQRPFIAARYHGGAQVPKAIVLHGTVTSDNPGTARSIAHWWAGSSSPKTSCQYVTDPREDIQCVGDHTVAYHCGYNTGSIGHEYCDEQVGPADRWQDADSQALLDRGALLDAELCLAYGIEPRRPSIEELRAKGPHGIYSHDDSRRAFGFTTHTDPRDFPWDQYFERLNWHLANLKGEIIRERVAINLVTFNVGDASYNDIKRVVDSGDVAALQECGDRAWVLDKLLAEGYGVIAPQILGAPSTPLIYDKTKLAFQREVIFQLLPKTKVGPGAGPSVSKPKYFVGGLFEVLGTGRLVIIGSAHNVATQGKPLRARAALRFTSALAKLGVARKATILCGSDWNAEQDDPSLAPLRKAGWALTPKRPTHGRRSIDFWATLKRKRGAAIVTWRGVSVIDGGLSDHDALLLRAWVIGKTAA